jgi:hypothetical protein
VKLRQILLSIIASIPLIAQDPPAKIIQIYREGVRPGAMPKYQQIEASAAIFCAKANCPNPYLAMTSITGPNEVWWVNGFDTVETMERVWHDYASNEQIMRQLDEVAGQKVDLVFPSVTLLAHFRDDLSFSSNTTFASARYMSISVVQVRPGQIVPFEKARLGQRAVQQRVGRTQWVYQVTSGTEDGTFLVITPGRTMQELHLFTITDDRTDAVLSSETRLYAVSPSMSMPARSWQELDPDFWKRP